MEIIDLNPPAIHGEIEAGEAKKVRKQLEQLINKFNKSQFDIGELLHVVKKNHYYTTDTFSAYVKTLDIKPRRAQYLEKIAATMEAVGITREQYEPLGVAKLRDITSLDVNNTWVNPETKEETPIKDFIVGFVEKGKDMDPDEIKNHVKVLKGLVGEEAVTWLNLSVKQSALDNVIRPALELCKMQIGSVAKNEEGMSIDASDGRALELIAADYLASNQE